MFLIASAVYFICATFYLVFGSGVRQEWDNPHNDAVHYYPNNVNGASDANENDRMLGKMKVPANNVSS